jgi:hypothetical protein
MADAIPTPIDGEQWRPVVGHEGWYEISDHGRVRRIAVIPGVRPGGILKPRFDKRGYHRYTLRQRTEQRHYYVQVLVLEAFVGPRPAPGYQCNHKDGNKDNNRPSNLEWVTPGDNQRHAFSMGLRIPHRGDTHPTAKITDAQVAEIKRLVGTEPNKVTAIRYGITPKYVAQLRRGRGRQGGT